MAKKSCSSTWSRSVKEFGYAIISAFITMSSGVSFWYMDLGFRVE